MDARASARPTQAVRTVLRSPADVNELMLVTAPFLPARAEPFLRGLCRLAGLAQDVVDDPSLDASAKTSRLDDLIATLEGRKSGGATEPPLIQWSADFASAAAEMGANVRHVLHLLQARRQDVSKHRYRDWNELIAYAGYAASPYGRIAVEAFDADKAAMPAAEALSCAILMLTLLSNCGSHYRMHGRVYLPDRWFKEAGAEIAALAAATADQPLRQVFAKMLDATDRLLLAARPLPDLIGDARGRGAGTALLCWATRSARRLRRGDPLAANIAMTRADRIIAQWRGHWRVVWR